MDKIRLQKYIAMSGICSRRKAEDLITQGKVIVNGKNVIELGTKVDVTDEVIVDGVVAKIATKKIYLMLNKPMGYVSTSKDQFDRPIILDLVKDIEERIYPVGRLDYNTSGLILLTNDGEFTNTLTHPKHHISKTYEGRVRGIIDESIIEWFKKGVKIDDYITKPAKLEILKVNNNNTDFKITIWEGRNRQIRKMFLEAEYSVVLLKRIAIGCVSLGDMAEGEYRHLKPQQVKKLMGELI